MKLSSVTINEVKNKKLVLLIKSELNNKMNISSELNNLLLKGMYYPFEGFFNHYISTKLFSFFNRAAGCKRGEQSKLETDVGFVPSSANLWKPDTQHHPTNAICRQVVECHKDML
jgi:hypothetical protein